MCIMDCSWTIVLSLFWIIKLSMKLPALFQCHPTVVAKVLNLWMEDSHKPLFYLLNIHGISLIMACLFTVGEVSSSSHCTTMCHTSDFKNYALMSMLLNRRYVLQCTCRQRSFNQRVYCLLQTFPIRSFS